MSIEQTKDNNSARVELLCPFCGGEALQHRVPSGHQVSCSECGAASRPSSADRVDEAEAIRTWNTRATPQPPESGSLREAASEYGWLIEHEDAPKWLTLRPSEAVYSVCWTIESNEALRFCRRVDAEDYVSAQFGGDGPVRITEHAWDMPAAAWNTRAAPQPPESGSLREALDKITEMLDLGRAEQEIITTVIRDVIRFADQRPTTQDAALREVLAWYGEQARLARLIHSEGDEGRHALAADGGKRAITALTNSAPAADQSATQGDAAGEDDGLFTEAATIIREQKSIITALTAERDLLQSMVGDTLYSKRVALEAQLTAMTAERDAAEKSLDEQVESSLRFVDEYDKIHAQLTTARQTIATLEADKLGMHDLIEQQRQTIAKFPEIVARAIYEQWRDRRGFVPWVLGGNSDVQHEARRIARQHIDAAIALTETKP